MREDLLGYLLNALDEAERRRVEQALQRDAQLQAELQRLRQQLSELPPQDPVGRPPRGLVDQTCDLVAGLDEVQSLATRRKNPATDSCGRRDCGQGDRPGRRLVDDLTTASLVLTVAALVFPALANSRYRSQVTACQNNLRNIGWALCDFSERQGGYFPQVPVSGNRAAAGICGPILVEMGFLADQRSLLCPGSQMARETRDWRVPTLEEIDRAQGTELSLLQRVMGGSYGYPLGYLTDGRHCPPRNEGRVYFALMADAPSLHLEERRSSNHCGRGQNVLFEDGHVAFVIECRAAPRTDALFVNRFGFAEAGADKDDSVIAASYMPPLAAATIFGTP